MKTLITNGIKISVAPFYQPEYSDPLKRKYIFSYHIHIENQSEYGVQLLHRHWYIFDSNGILREVEGEGVVGEKPILMPGGTHQYSSWCHLITDMGKMWGEYIMERQDDLLKFEVQIPEFHLVAPFKLN